ncbi:MAG: EamA family transporter [Candidatus Koribacter versatilis]|uniref:EamA family transporter n=1 Tax=Candidatus Korobacter versatilis TaxID=658062 RepID=A0A932A8Z6_9BACT|nr:EamA family transporter [Candidatus Koribacter versatilis]
MDLKKYLVLAGIIVSGAVGDVLLSRGMRAMPPADLGHLPQLLHAIFTPWIAGGTFFLLIFFACYLTALTWADLTFVLPAAALDYVLLAFLSQWFLHEHVTVTRWLGILLITAGVGFVTRGPALTPLPETAEAVHEEAAHHHRSASDPSSAVRP